MSFESSCKTGLTKSQRKTNLHHHLKNETARAGAENTNASLTARWSPRPRSERLTVVYYQPLTFANKRSGRPALRPFLFDSTENINYTQIA